MAKAKNRPERKQMDEETLSTIMKGLIEDARDYSEEIGEMRESATKAYRGALYGNEKQGRSQVVTREVRDAVQMAMPAIMRVLFGSHDIVKFEGNQEEDVQAARDATLWVRHLINNVNDGYEATYAAVQDAILRKTGVLKAWFEEEERPRMTRHSGLTQMEIDVLAGDDAVTQIEAEMVGEDPNFGPLFDADVTRVEKSGKIRFEAVPPEEALVSRDAKNFWKARLVGHEREITLSDLRELGYDQDTVDDLEMDVADGDDGFRDSEEEARSIGNTTDDDEGETQDPSQKKVLYAECWVRVDFDGDGIAELRRVCVAGSGFRVLENEMADIPQMVDMCPSPVAHQAIGESLAELVEDIQKIKTMVTRNTLDSLAQSIHPDTEAVEGQVNFNDLMKPGIGRIIRVKAPGMLQYQTPQFVGESAFAMLQYMDTIGESRTGLNQASQGLNADAMQSTARVAVENATASANARIEFITRTMIETGFKRFFRLLLRLSINHMQRAEKVRLNNQFIEVDPRSWNSDMDVTVTVALGAGTIAERRQLLMDILAKQEQVMQVAGPDNPLAGLKEYRHTLAELTRLSGVADVSSYWKDPEDPQSQPEPKPPAPDPQLILAQSEMASTQATAQNNQQQFMLDVWKAIQEDDRARDKLIADTMIQAEKLSNDGAKVNMQGIKQEIDRERNTFDAVLKMTQAQAKAQSGPGEGQGGQQ